MRLLHILNFFSGSADHDKVQQRTILSLHNASAAIKKFGIDVEYLFVGSPQDIAYAEHIATQQDVSIAFETVTTPSSLHHDFLHGRSNPTLAETFFCTQVRELIDSKSIIEQDTLILISNTDICLRPHAYLGIYLIHRRDPSASFVINRETVSLDLLARPLTEAFASHGTVHPGHDFFCLPPSLYRQVDLEPDGHIIGFGFVMRPLLANLIFSQAPFWEIGSSRLTFHYGDDMQWKDPKWDGALEYNKSNMQKVYWRLHKKCHSSCSQEKKNMLDRFFPQALVGSPSD